MKKYGIFMSLLLGTSIHAMHNDPKAELWQEICSEKDEIIASLYALEFKMDALKKYTTNKLYIDNLKTKITIANDNMHEVQSGLRSFFPSLKIILTDSSSDVPAGSDSDDSNN